MLELFRIAGKIDLEGADKAERDLDKIDGKGQSLGSKIGGVAKGVGAAGVAIGAAFVGAAGSAAGLATKAANAGDRIDKMSQQLGMSRSGFQEWDFILSQSGSSIESMQMGMKTLTQRMQQSADGTGKGAEAFERLGISVYDSNGNMKDQEDILEESIRAFQGMEDGVEKASLANDLFGRSGQELLPLLNGQRGSLDELKDKYEELGIEMDDSAIDASVRFTDTMDQLKRSMGFVFNVIGAELLPIFQRLADWVIDNLPTIQAIFSTVFEAIGAVVSKAGEWIGSLLDWMTEWYNRNKETLIGIYEAFSHYLGLAWAYVQEAFSAIKEVVNEALTFVRDFIRDALETVRSNWETNGQQMVQNGIQTFNTIKETVATAFEFIWSIISTILGLVVPFLQTQLARIQQFWEQNGEKIMTAVENAFKFIQGVIEFVMPIVIAIIEGAWAIIQAVFETAIGVIMGLVEFFASLLTGDFEGMKDALISIWESLWEGIKGIVAGAWGLLSGAFAALWEQISGWFTGLKDQALEWGANMIDGFIDGIKSKFAAVGQAAKGAVDAAADFIKFWSPAKKGEGRYIVHWGANMVDGFLDGVRKEAKQAGKVMNDVIGNMNPVNIGANVKPIPGTSDTNPVSNSKTYSPTFNFHSPKELSPSEARRKALQASRQFAMEWGV